MAEYIENSPQNVTLGQSAIFDSSIPCNRGYVFHEDGTGIFILRGITNNCFARYQVTFNGNIAVPDGGTAVPIAVVLAVNGEPRLTSRAIFTPTAAGDYGNVTSTAIITVPKGCCFSLSIRYVTVEGVVTPAPEIELQNANLTVARIA